MRMIGLAGAGPVSLTEPWMVPVFACARSSPRDEPATRAAAIAAMQASRRLSLLREILCSLVIGIPVLEMAVLARLIDVFADVEQSFDALLLGRLQRLDRRALQAVRIFQPERSIRGDLCGDL